MHGIPRCSRTGLPLLFAALVLVVLTLSSQPAHAATVETCSPFGTVDVNGKVYEVQNDEWNSTLPQCISVNNVSGAFTVTTASANMPTNGPPASYPSIFKGCHWGNCTVNSAMPIQVSAISTATSSWNTTQPTLGVYDVAYDIWFNTTPTAPGQPDGAELMIWINHRGAVQPVGSKIASAVPIGGATWDVWFGNIGWNVISYVRTTGATSVGNLDLRSFTYDAVSRGYIRTAWYLIAVEAGFELWQGGVGLATNSFSVSVSAGGSATATPARTNTPGPSATPTRTATPRPTATSTPTPGGGGGNLKVQLHASGSDDNQRADFYYRVVNTGTAAQSNISVRVYFTLDGSEPASSYVLEKWWDQSGAAVVSGPTYAFGSTYYFTVDYGSASLSPGASWEYQTTMHLKDWSYNVNAWNDFWHGSAPLPASYTDWPLIPAFAGGSLVWGSIP